MAMLRTLQGLLVVILLAHCFANLASTTKAQALPDAESPPPTGSQDATAAESTPDAPTGPLSTSGVLTSPGSATEEAAGPSFVTLDLQKSGSLPLHTTGGILMSKKPGTKRTGASDKARVREVIDANKEFYDGTLQCVKW